MKRKQKASSGTYKKLLDFSLKQQTLHAILKKNQESLKTARASYLARIHFIDEILHCHTMS